MKLMHDGYTRHGEVFTVPVLHKKFTFLLGPHVSGHFFKANDDEMSQKEVSRAQGMSLVDSTLNMTLFERSLCRLLRKKHERPGLWHLTEVRFLLCRCMSLMCQLLAREWFLMWITR